MKPTENGYLLCKQSKRHHSDRNNYGMPDIAAQVSREWDAGLQVPKHPKLAVYSYPFSQRPRSIHIIHASKFYSRDIDIEHD